jgi:hypothetical protein
VARVTGQESSSLSDFLADTLQVLQVRHKSSQGKKLIRTMEIQDYEYDKTGRFSAVDREMMGLSRRSQKAMVGDVFCTSSFGRKKKDSLIVFGRYDQGWHSE